MLKGKVRFGTDAQTFQRWDQDALSDYLPKDQVFGWTVRSTKVLHYNKAKVKDDVLSKMRYQGLLDKKASAPAWTEQSSVKHGVHFMLNMIIRVLQWIFKIDDKEVILDTSFLYRS